MITTFFGAHSFGGDASYVDRLSRALLQRGHHVDVVYSLDAWQAVRGDLPPRPYQPPPGLGLRPLQPGRWNPLWIHQTGRAGALGPLLRQTVAARDYDVLHIHNASLTAAWHALDLGAAQRPVCLLSAHDHWLTCPLSSLWKFDREPCEQRACLACTLHAGRPPQLWRIGGRRLPDSLARLDALVFPSAHAQQAHSRRGIDHLNIQVLPYFIPDSWIDRFQEHRATAAERAPIFAVVGRLVKEKGFQDVIEQMADLPAAELHIAGAGPYEPELRRLAQPLPNVKFLGWLDEVRLAELYSRARALVVPSLFYETFGYVVAEALAARTPCIVRDRGALPDSIRQTGGGRIFQSAQDLAAGLRELACDAGLANQLGQTGRRQAERLWSEQAHLERYLQLIASLPRS